MLVCALTPGCIDAALGMAQDIGRYGANTWEGVREWTAEELWRATDDWPWQEKTRDRVNARDKGGETTSPQPPVGPCFTQSLDKAAREIAKLILEQTGKKVDPTEVTRTIHQAKKDSGIPPNGKTTFNVCTGDIHFGGGEILDNIVDYFK